MVATALKTLPNCPVCASPLIGATTACVRCDTSHHADCMEYAGGCAVFGCDRRDNQSTIFDFPPWAVHLFYFIVAPEMYILHLTVMLCFLPVVLLAVGLDRLYDRVTGTGKRLR